MPALEKNRVLTIAIILAVVLGIWYIMRPSPIPVDTATIKKGALEVTVNEEGVTKIREIYKVSAPVSGRMLRSPREIGDEVEQNKTLIATIKPADPAFLDNRSRAAAQAAVKAAQAAVKLAKAQVNRAAAELEYAQTDMVRAKKLSRKQTISQKAMEQAELLLKTRQATLETAKAELDVRKQELNRAQAHLIEPEANGKQNKGPCCVEVMAPVSGRVLNILTESETVVASGTNIMEIGNPEDLEIEVDLLSGDAVRIKEGATVIIDNWGGPEILKGNITRIDPSGFMKVSALGIEEQRVKAKISIDTPKKQWSRLGHNYRVFVRISVWNSADTLQIPLSALFRKRDNWAVFKIENNTAKLQLVKIGQRNTQYAQILEGLKEGETVILHPSERIENNTTIQDRAELK